MTFTRPKKHIMIVLMSIICCLSVGVATIYAAYSSEIKTATRPGYVSQSGTGSDPLTWTDVTATTSDVASNQRLFYSNNPELIPKVNNTVYNQGIIYNSAVRSDGGRVYLHHYNNSDLPGVNVTVALLARNVGNSTGSLTIGKYGDGAGASLLNPLDVGANAVRQYFSNPPRNTTFSGIPVDGWVTVASKTISRNQTASMVMDLTYNGAFRLYVAYVTSASSYSTPLAFAQASYNSSSSYLWSTLESTVRGDALHTRSINVSFNPDNLINRRLRINSTFPNDSIISTADYTWNISSPTTQSFQRLTIPGTYRAQQPALSPETLVYYTK